MMPRTLQLISVELAGTYHNPGLGINARNIAEIGIFKDS